MAGPPNRSPMARAFTPSLSHNATRSAPRIFDRIGRCAVWGTAPTPTRPTRTSLEEAKGRSGVVGSEDGTERLARARPADGSPLAHSDAMAVAATSEDHATSETTVRVLRLDRKIGRVHDRATGRAHDVANVVAAQREAATIRLDHESSDTPRRRGVGDEQLPRACRSTRGHRRIARQVL